MIRIHSKFFLLAFTLVMLPFSLQAQSQAILPYSLASKYMDLFKSLAHLDRIVPEMIVASTNPSVKPESIEFKIKPSNSWQTFRPNENGIIQLPDNPDWAAMSFISNQPKGTLQLGVSFSAVPLTSTQVSYQELMVLVPQFREALEALATVQAQPAPEVNGLTVQLPEGSDAGVRINSKNGNRTIKSYATGIVVIKYDETLWQENPSVEFDQMPVGIVPSQ